MSNDEEMPPATGLNLPGPSETRHGPAPLGTPTSFSSGPFQGETIRATLEEIQQPLLGRKFAIKDRRPVDPPPIVRLRLFKVLGSGTDHKTEQEIDTFEDAQVQGHLCHVDLFRAPAPAEPPPGEGTSKTTRRRSSRAASSSVPIGTLSPVLHYIDSQPITESAKCTEALCGSTVAQAVNIGYEKQRALMFVFGDISVKLHGFFVMRYRFFDLFSSVQPNSPPPVLAECFGGRFHIYSTKRFPGLPASTALTKHVAMWGVRLSVRETPRKRRKQEQDDGDEDDDEGGEGSGSSDEE